MSKQIIRINESQLKNIVKKSIQAMLNEDRYHSPDEKLLERIDLDLQEIRNIIDYWVYNSDNVEEEINRKKLDNAIGELENGYKALSDFREGISSTQPYYNTMYGD